MARFGSLGTQYFDNSGNILSNGTIGFYSSGTTESPANLITIYSDINQTTPIDNPTTLDAYGRQTSIFFTGIALGVLRTQGGVLVQSLDPIGDVATGEQFQPWIASYSYDENAIVLGSDGNFYLSLASGNLGNDPISSPLDWELFASSIIAQQTSVTAGYTAIGDSTTGLTGINTKTKGTIAVGNGTTTTTLAVGSNNAVLIADSAESAGVKWGSLGGITYGTPTAATSGTSIDYTSLPTGIKRLTALFDRVSLNSAPANLSIQLGTSGGFVVSGYNASTVRITTGPSVSAANTTIGFAATVDAASSTISGYIQLVRLGDGSNTWHAIGILSSSANYTYYLGGTVALGAELTKLRFSTYNGAETFDSGTVNIAWEI